MYILPYYKAEFASGKDEASVYCVLMGYPSEQETALGISRVGSASTVSHRLSHIFSGKLPRVQTASNKEIKELTSYRNFVFLL